jgi:hypothetical protein
VVDFAAHTARIINRLGQPVTLTPAGGPARVVNAVFTSSRADVFGVVGTEITLRATAADAAGMAATDAVAIGADAYTITSVWPDDSGDVVMGLQKA